MISEDIAPTTTAEIAVSPTPAVARRCRLTGRSWPCLGTFSDESVRDVAPGAVGASEARPNPVGEFTRTACARRTPDKANQQRRSCGCRPDASRQHRRDNFASVTDRPNCLGGQRANGKSASTSQISRVRRRSTRVDGTCNPAKCDLATAVGGSYPGTGSGRWHRTVPRRLRCARHRPGSEWPGRLSHECAPPPRRSPA